MNEDTNRQNDQQADISKSQSAQQPRGEADQARDAQLDSNASGQTPDATGGQPGMADYGSAEQADAKTQNRTDIEGSSLNAEPTDPNSGGFVGSDSQSDTSSELIDDDSEAPAGK